MSGAQTIIDMTPASPPQGAYVPFVVPDTSGGLNPLINYRADFGTFVFSSLTRVATRAALSLLSSAYGFAYLTEAGRQGIFQWSGSNLASFVSADTQQGIYVAPSGQTGSHGAWVRALPTAGVWDGDWFGLPADPASGNGGPTQVTANAEFSAMINLGNLVKPGQINLPAKILTFAARVPEISWQVILNGVRGAQGTILVKRYVEADAARGVLAFNDYGFSLNGFSIRAGSGSGGSLWSAILTGPAPAAGKTFIHDMNFSGGNFVNYSIYVNGSTNTTAGTASYRGLYMSLCEVFGAAVSCIKLVSVQHWLAADLLVTTTGGSGTSCLDTDGDVNAYNDNWQFQGIFSGGTVSLKQLGRANFVSPQTSTITADVTCTDIMWFGPRFGGVVVNNAASGEFVFARDGLIVATGGNSTTGWRVFGDGRLIQWGQVATNGSGVASGTWPLAFSATTVKASANTTTDPGAGLICVAQILAASTTAYTIKCAVANFSGAGTLGPSSSTVTYEASGVS